MNTDKIYAESIANQYAVKDATKVVQLRKLDQKAKLPANIFAYTFGVVATLLLGIGMCLCMNVIGSGTTAMTAIGVVVGVAGIAGICTNYPIYKKILEKGKNKYGSDIIRLAKEIADEESKD
ncbi:MAG: dihydropteridine reductase [Clostridiales bacterium]|nr:dihydropteridine reductase [Clostridiales bacterium]MDY2720859.1 dihydropteridine reductase [Eubacteriales bacterium]